MKDPKTTTVTAKKPSGKTATLEIFYDPTKNTYVIKNVCTEKTGKVRADNKKNLTTTFYN